MDLKAITAKISTDLERPLKNLTTGEILYYRQLKTIGGRRKGGWSNHTSWMCVLELLRREGRVV